MLIYYEKNAGLEKNRYKVNSKVCSEMMQLSLSDIIEHQYEATVECFHIIEHLIQRLEEGVYDIVGAVFVIEDSKELEIIIDNKAFLRDIYLLLIIYNEDPAMVSTALELRPRYIVCWKKERKYVISILQNFIRIIKQREMLMLHNDLLNVGKHKRVGE